MATGQAIGYNLLAT